MAMCTTVSYKQKNERFYLVRNSQPCSNCHHGYQKHHSTAGSAETFDWSQKKLPWQRHKLNVSMCWRSFCCY